jgi:hypothetical protein
LLSSSSFTAKKMTTTCFLPKSGTIVVLIYYFAKAKKMTSSVITWHHSIVVLQEWKNDDEQLLIVILLWFCRNKKMICRHFIIVLQEQKNDNEHHNYMFVTTPLWRCVRMTLTLPKWGLGSPSGLPKIWNSIVGVKTPRLEVFFIPLESSWSVDVENGLSWAIRTSLAQVMCERRAKSQIGCLTPNH